MRFVWWDLPGLGLVLLSWTLLLVAVVAVHDFVFVAWFAKRSLLDGSWEFTPVGKVLWWSYGGICGLTVWSQLRAMLADPGIMRGLTHENAKRKCEKCSSWKPVRAYHCRICGDCVFRMDHHCPWVNNCVGYGNLKFFVLFTGYVSLLAICNLVVLGTGSYLWLRSGLEMNKLAAVMGCTAALESGFFLWFAGDFFAEQFEAIETNTTLVESYKSIQGANIQQTTFYQRFVEIFGRNPLLWLLPIHTTRMPPDFFEGVLKEIRPATAFAIGAKTSKGQAEVADGETEEQKAKFSQLRAHQSTSSSVQSGWGTLRSVSTRPNGDVEHLERATREIRRLRTELADARSKASCSEEKASRKLASLEAGISERDSRIVEVQSWNRSLMEQIESLEKTNKDLLEELTAKNAELRETTKAVEYERSRGGARVNELEEEKTFMQNTWKAKEIELRADLERLKAAVSSLSAKASVAAPTRNSVTPSPSSASSAQAADRHEDLARVGALVKDLSRMVEDKQLKRTLVKLTEALVDPGEVENFRLAVEEFFEKAKKIRRSRASEQFVEDEVFPRKVEISCPTQFSVSCQTDFPEIAKAAEIEKKNARLTSLVKDLRTQVEVLTLTKKASTPAASVSVTPVVSPERPRTRAESVASEQASRLQISMNSSSLFQDGDFPRRLQVRGSWRGGGGGRRQIEESAEGALRIRANLE